MLARQTVEKHQVLVYLAVAGCGLATGMLLPGRLEMLKVTLWPLLALLLYTIFAQVPLARLPRAVFNTGFTKAAIVGNFVVIPVLVWGLVQLLPNDPAVRLGVLLVLLVPCTDWFIAFTHLGGGDTRSAIGFAPVSLLLQFGLLPVYLWLFLGETFAVAVVRQEMLVAFVGLIVLPLLAAFITQKWAERIGRRREVQARLAFFPVPLLALVVFVIVVTQVDLITASLGVLGHLLLIFVGFLFIAGLLSRIIAGVFDLPLAQGRVLAFSLGTRNSFVVLPLALALPASFELAVVAIVFQSIVELLGMAVYLLWVPKKLFPARP